MLHPDRFHQTDQSAEWQLANEMLKELNCAYTALKDPSSRAEYDRSIGRPTSPPRQTPPPNKAESPKPRGQASHVKLGKLTSGHAIYQSLPKAIQIKLLERQSESIKNQFRAKLGGVLWQYGGISLSIGWFVLLSSFVTDIKWQSNTVLWYAAFSIAACAVGAACAAWIVRYHQSPLKCDFYVTPLYFIRTHLEELWYWPIWDLKDIRATHRYQNGAYQNTDVTIVFPSKTEQIKIKPEKAYSWMIDALRAFDQKVKLARQQEDWTYFYHEDDFREAPADVIPLPKTKSTTTVGAYVISFTIGLIAFFIACKVNSRNSHPSNLAGPSLSDSAIRNQPAAPRATPYRVPVVTPKPVPADYPEPQNGYVFKNILTQGRGNLTISNGTSSHAVVKLIDIAAEKSVFTAFVRANNNLIIAHIPNGRYRLLFAAGRGWDSLDGRFRERHGSSAFDDPLEFTTSERVEGDSIVTYYDTMQVTLNPVINGKAKTESIGNNEFERY